MLGEIEAEVSSDDNAPAEDAGKGRAGDYVEESDTPDGGHVRKEVHQGPGFKTVRITTQGGSGGSVLGRRGPSLMQAMMQDMM